jgi:hypothetical protein
LPGNLGAQGVRNRGPSRSPLEAGDSGTGSGSITSRIERSTEPTQLLLDVSTAQGGQTGLIMNSVVNCVNLFTVEQSKILRSLGRLSPPLMREIEDCLKAAFSLP